MTDTENFNKMMECCKNIELKAKAQAQRDGVEAFELIKMSNNPPFYCKVVKLIVYEEFPKNNDIINIKYEQEVIDNIKMYGKKIYDAGGMEMMIICFKMIIGLVYDNNRRAYQSFLNMCWYGVGEWYG
jgi:hypothetical protein|tara:strand:+ start:278 stop:661 length:384 start_codon:yes stop_codon:yes gene_type:complete